MTLQPPQSSSQGANVAGSAAVTSASTIAAMGLGGVLAIIVLLKYGKDAETDGFFAAFGVYAVLLALAQSLRATAVAKLVEGPSVFDSLDRLIGAALIAVLASGVVLVGLGDPVAGLLTGDLGPAARDTARTALAILWLAAGAQFVAALMAAALGTRDDFGLPGLAYVAGGLFAIATVLTLGSGLGIDAVSVGVAAGATLTVGLMLWRLARFGYRPQLKRLRQGPRALGTLGLVLAGSAGSIGLQITYVASLTFAARIGEGAVTLYSYAFFAASLLMGAVVGPAAIVLAAPVARTWDRRPESLRPHLLAVFQVSQALVGPVFAVAALVGDELVEVVLGSSLTASDADAIVTTFLALGGMIAATVALPVPALAAFATSRYLAVGLVAIAALAVHVAASAVAIELGGLTALAAAASLSAVVSLALMLVVVYGRKWLTPFLLLARELLRMLVVLAVAFGPPGLLAAALGGGAWDVPAAAVGIAVYAVALWSVLPEHRQLVGRIIEPLAQRRARRAVT